MRGVTLECGNCAEIVESMPDNSVDSVVCDPPYALVSITKRFGKPGSAPAKDVYGRAAVAKTKGNITAHAGPLFGDVA